MGYNVISMKVCVMIIVIGIFITTISSCCKHSKSFQLAVWKYMIVFLFNHSPYCAVNH